MNQNLSPSTNRAAQCPILLIALLIPVAEIHAQTQAAKNAQAHTEFEKADADLNKTYDAVLAKPSAGRFEAHFKLFNELQEKLNEHKN